MAVKYSEIVAFFEELAEKHVLIKHNADDSKHFYRMDLDEFVSGVGGFEDYNLLLEEIPFKIDGSKRDNSIKTREISFIVAKNLKEKSKSNISTAFDECEVIVDDILSKLNEAREIFSATVISFDENSIEVMPVSDGKNFGYRCTIDIKSPYNFVVNPNNWTI